MFFMRTIPQHPDVEGDFNEALVTAARHAMLCSLFCTSCADTGAAEGMDMCQCIRTSLDCAATAQLATRRTVQNVNVLRAPFETCVRACDICAAKCDRHDHEHCRLCAQICRECAEGCRKALPSVH